MAEIKPHYSEKRSILADVVPLDMPYSIQVEPSQVCNMKCSYCIHSMKGEDGFPVANRRRNKMDLDTFEMICEGIGDFDRPVKQLNFAGWGEPLINSQLSDMISMAVENEVAENVAVITNGLWLVPEITAPLLDAGVNHIRISLQGMSAEAYKIVSGKDINFEQYVENIGWLYQHKGGCKVSIKVADIALKEGEEKLFYDTFGPITDQMYVEKIRPMFPQQTQDGKAVSKYGIEHKPVMVCPLPFFMMSITADGDILPCCNYYDPLSLGNVEHGLSLVKAWNSDTMKTFRKMLLNAPSAGERDWMVCRGCVMPDAVITPGDELDERAAEIRGKIK